MQRHPVLAAIGVAVLGLSALTGAAAPIALAATCGAGSSTLQDGGFETPIVGAGTFQELDASLVPPWKTTDVANQIEIWGTGFLGVPAAVGGQFVEINANSPGTLSQDVVTTPGVTMTWSIQHRGREGADTMKVLIGDAATADVNSDVGWSFISPDLTDDTSGWGTHTASYVVPAGQTCTRFGFRAVSAAGGNPSIGNFLDDAGFRVAVPPSPSPRPSPRPTPPVTATIGADPTTGGGPAALVILLMAAAGLALGVRYTPRRGRRRRQ